MKQKFYNFYMDIAIRTAELSYCERKKVGAIIVKNDNIISYGYNGTLPGQDNVCEDNHGNTKPEVIHAEMNALNKITKSVNSSMGGTMFITMAPCQSCSPHIIMAGIREIVFYENYRLPDGLDILRKNGIKITDYKELKC